MLAALVFAPYAVCWASATRGRRPRGAVGGRAGPRRRRLAAALRAADPSCRGCVRRARRSARPVVRAVPHGRAGCCCSRCCRGSPRSGWSARAIRSSARPGLAAAARRARLAAGQGLAGQPPERPGAAGARWRPDASASPGRPASSRRQGPTAGQPSPARPAGPAAPGQACAGPARRECRRAGDRRGGPAAAAAGPVPGRPASTRTTGRRAAGDHRRRGDGGARRDDRPGRR